MDSPKDRANNRKPVTSNHTDAELLEKFNDLHKKIVESPSKPMTFSDDPSSRNTGWFFSGK